MKIDQQGLGCIGDEPLQLVAGVGKSFGGHQLRTAGAAGEIFHGMIAIFDRIGRKAVGAENV